MMRFGRNVIYSGDNEIYESEDARERVRTCSKQVERTPESDPDPDSDSEKARNQGLLCEQDDLVVVDGTFD